MSSSREEDRSHGTVAKSPPAHPKSPSQASAEKSGTVLDDGPSPSTMPVEDPVVKKTVDKILHNPSHIPPERMVDQLTEAERNAMMNDYLAYRLSRLEAQRRETKARLAKLEKKKQHEKSRSVSTLPRHHHATDGDNNQMNDNQGMHDGNKNEMVKKWFDAKQAEYRARKLAEKESFGSVAHDEEARKQRLMMLKEEYEKRKEKRLKAYRRRMAEQQKYYSSASKSKAGLYKT
jgi:hypothetical protein